MRARRMSLAKALWTLLVAGILSLWIRSYFRDDLLWLWPKPTVLFAIESREGSLHVGLTLWRGAPSIYFNRLASSPLYDAWRYITLRSLVDFRLTAGRGRFFNDYGLKLPVWSLCLLPAIIQVWMLYRRRHKVRLAVRDDIAWMNPRLRERLIRFAVFSSAGILAGAVIGVSDILTPHPWRGRVFVAIALLLPVVALMSVFTRRRIPWHRALLWLALEIAGCLCFYQATMERIWSWSRLNIYDISDLLQLVFCMGAAGIVLGAILLLVLQVKPEPIKPGPYCPECGYCLIGSTARICSECGRPFTLEELGVTAETLALARTAPA